MTYIDQTDCEALLSAPTLLQIYDDQNTGQIDGAALNKVIGFACSKVDGYLARVYPGPFPIAQNPTPQLIKLAALGWFRALSFERHTEYVRQYGTKPREDAVEECERLCKAREFLSDLIASPKPGNVGGIVTNAGPRMITTTSTGDSQSGDF